MFQEKQKEKKTPYIAASHNESGRMIYICVGSGYIREEPRDNVNNDYIQSLDVTINLYGVSRNQTILSGAGRDICGGRKYANHLGEMWQIGADGACDASGRCVTEKWRGPYARIIISDN